MYSSWTNIETMRYDDKGLRTSSDLRRWRRYSYDDIYFAAGLQKRYSST